MRGPSVRQAMRPAILIALIFLVPAVLAARQKHPRTYRIPLPPKPDFSSIEWMIGNWTGQMGKHSPPGQIHLSVSYDLGQRVMIFRETVSIAATGEIGAADESSIGILSPAPSGHSFLMQVYGSTGFVTRYRVTVSGSEIDLMPDGGLQPPPGWLSRRIIQHGDVNGFTETVQLAPPMETFFNYYTAAFTRQAAPQSSKPESSGGLKKPPAKAPGSQGTTTSGKPGKTH